MVTISHYLIVCSIEDSGISSISSRLRSKQCSSTVQCSPFQCRGLLAEGSSSRGNVNQCSSVLARRLTCRQQQQREAVSSVLAQRSTLLPERNFEDDPAVDKHAAGAPFVAAVQGTTPTVEQYDVTGPCLLEQRREGDLMLAIVRLVHTACAQVLASATQATHARVPVYLMEGRDAPAAQHSSEQYCAH